MMLHYRSAEKFMPYEDMAFQIRRLGAVCSRGSFFADNGFGEFEKVDTVQVVNWFHSAYEYPEDK